MSEPQQQPLPPEPIDPHVLAALQGTKPIQCIDELKWRMNMDRERKNLSPKMQAPLYGGFFRSAAGEFRKLAPEWPPTLLYPPAKGMAIQERVGTLIIEAHNLNLFPPFPGLAKVVERHNNAPVKLFNDLFGGDKLLATSFVQSDGRKVYIPQIDERGQAAEVGGLLPGLVPRLLDLPKPERYAQNCEWLAQLIKAAGQPNPPARQEPEQVQTPVQVGKQTRKGKGKRINDRITAKLVKDPDTIAWSIREWASQLHCATSTIQESEAWKTILRARENAKLDSGVNQERESQRDGRRQKKRRSVDD